MNILNIGNFENKKEENELVEGGKHLTKIQTKKLKELIIETIGVRTFHGLGWIAKMECIVIEELCKKGINIDLSNRLREKKVEEVIRKKHI